MYRIKRSDKIVVKIDQLASIELAPSIVQFEHRRHLTAYVLSNIRNFCIAARTAFPMHM